MYSSPVRHSPASYCYDPLPFDLHVLGMPPAFNLSQDQTLQLKTSGPKTLFFELNVRLQASLLTLKICC